MWENVLRIEISYYEHVDLFEDEVDVKNIITKAHQNI